MSAFGPQWLFGRSYLCWGIQMWYWYVSWSKSLYSWWCLPVFHSWQLPHSYPQGSFFVAQSYYNSLRLFLLLISTPQVSFDPVWIAQMPISQIQDVGHGLVSHSYDPQGPRSRPVMCSPQIWMDSAYQYTGAPMKLSHCISKILFSWHRNYIYLTPMK